MVTPQTGLFLDDLAKSDETGRGGEGGGSTKSDVCTKNYIFRAKKKEILVFKLALD